MTEQSDANLDVSPEAIQRRLDDLVNRGLLERRLNEQTGEREYRRTQIGTELMKAAKRHG